MTVPAPASPESPEPRPARAAASDAVIDLVRRFRRARIEVSIDEPAAGRVTIRVPWFDRLTDFQAKVRASDATLVQWLYGERDREARPGPLPSRAELMQLIDSEEPLPEGARWRAPEVMGSVAWQPFAHYKDGLEVESDWLLATVDVSRRLVTSISRRWTDIPEAAYDGPVAVLTPETGELTEAELKDALARLTRQRFARWHPEASIGLDERDFAVRFSAPHRRRLAEVTYDVWIERGAYTVEVDAATGEGLLFEDPDLVGGGPADDAATALVLEAAGEIAKTGLLAEGADEKATALVEAPDGVLVRAVYETETDDGELRTQVFDLDPGTRQVARYRLTRG